MDNFDFERDKRQIEDRKRRYQEQRQDKAKKKLSDRLVKNMETIMIGSLEEFEEGFGHLWGHDQEGELTKEQQEFADLWQEVRTKLLDRANLKILQSEREIDKYAINFISNYYKINLRDRK